MSITIALFKEALKAMEWRECAHSQSPDQLAVDVLLNLPFALAGLAFRLWLVKASPDIRLERVPDVFVDNPEIEPVRIEMTAAPAPHVSMFGILPVGHDGQEILKTAGTADIFRWPGASAIYAGRCPWNRVQGQEFLDCDEMLPVIAEVIKVDEREAWAALEIQKPDLIFIKGPGLSFIFYLAELFRIAIAQTANLELVQVVVPPVEGGLDDEMQLSKMPVPWNDHAAPHGRLDAG
ncbi:hypothetical protein AU467_25585 [Mesorhizobium loti]|uniref:Uncharacterized protein n=1 Tax=Rhizobium loti TaxID=381 RepID=A0A101KRC9_RHILI|nr:hypothetical protein AU467_25585 [Mesorhizobium loti]